MNMRLDWAASSAFLALASVGMVVMAVGCGDSGSEPTGGNGGSGAEDGGGSPPGGGGPAEGGAGGGPAPTLYGSYTESASPAEFIEVCGADATRVDNTISSAIDLPFTFPFYNKSFDTVRVSINGWISFSQFITESAPRNDDGVLPLPEFGSPNAVIYGFWEALVLRDAEGNVSLDGLMPCYATVGEAPNRSFVVQWDDAYFFDPGLGNTITDEIAFEIVLNEADSTVDVLYKTIAPQAEHVARAGGVTIGVENEDTSPDQAGNGGTKATAATIVPASGTGIRFTPVPR